MVVIIEMNRYLRRLSRGCFRLAMLLAWACLVAPPARAADHGAPASNGHGGSAAPSDSKLPRTFDLGEFDIRNFRPTHNEIANIKFSLHVVLAPTTSDAELAELENWKRRLRDQAITAVRSADAVDLAEPTLTHVQKIMLLRIKRLPLPTKEPVVGLYLTDFAVSSG
jgi:hypothetical protein